MDGNFHLLIKKVFIRRPRTRSPLREEIYSNTTPPGLQSKPTSPYTGEAFLSNEASWQGAEERALL